MIRLLRYLATVNLQIALEYLSVYVKNQLCCSAIVTTLNRFFYHTMDILIFLITVNSFLYI